MSLVSEALERATSQFQASPKVLVLLEAIVGPLDAVSATAGEFRAERWIDAAIGKQLDGCGYIVGELRAGRDDDAYRNAIRFRVFVNISEGTPNALIDGLQYLIDSDDKQYIEMYPATAILFADGPDVPIDIQTQIQDLAPAGISDVPVLVSYTELPFRFMQYSDTGDLFVNNGADYLTANGSDIQITTVLGSFTGPTFGGIAPAELTAGVQLIDVNGSILVIHDSEYQTKIESGYHLTGVFQ